MKILVTGGSGFIGSNFILNQINHSNNSIINFDNLTYAGRNGNLKKIESSSRYFFIKGDIANAGLLEKTFSEFMPDAIINFAAESHVDKSIDSPQNFIKTNIVGTYELLMCAKNYIKTTKCENFKFIHISTDEVYGSLGHDGFFTEKSPYNPNSPYSATKAASDFLVKSWHKTFELPGIITNCSNNYGPYQHPEKLIPLMIISCLNERELPVYGDGKNVRDWLHVDDHCRAINIILNDGDPGETYNIGGNNELSNIEIVNKICDILDRIKPNNKISSYRDLITFVKDRPGHDFRYAIDSNKLKKSLGWLPIENIESGLEKTVLWYLENESWWRKI